MTEPPGRIAWIAIAPVKSMALVFLERAELGRDGIRGDRAFAVVDGAGRLVNGKRAGTLAAVRVGHNVVGDSLTMAFPDGTAAGGPVRLGVELGALFFGEPRPARIVDGPWSAALSRWSGQSLRLVAMAPGEGPDRGPTVSLLSSAAVSSLARAGGADEGLDPRRFRMTFGLDDVAAHAEDGWVGRAIRIGGAVIRIEGNVGRCAVTTHDPDTGRPSFDTLHVLNHQRRHLPTTEPLPFGVWASVVAGGEVALGDPVETVP